MSLDNSIENSSWVHSWLGCNQKKEGERPNNTLTICMGLGNLVISELLQQNTTTDPFPHTSSLSISICIV